MSVYSELIKDFGKVRDYVRDFYIFGFRTREDFDGKSKRTYDNEKRRIESWLSDHIHTSLNGHKKTVSVKIDSSHIFKNPLYQCYKSKSYTDNDIRLHFILMDMLDGNMLTVSEITDRIASDYGMIFDIQIVRIKLREYADEGLIIQKKIGKTMFYAKSELYADTLTEKFSGLADMIKYFSEETPFGAVGSFILDKLNTSNDVFTRKHAYMVHTLDDEILLQVIDSMRRKKLVTLSCISTKKRSAFSVTVVPLKIHSSLRTGRNYIIVYQPASERLSSVRLDFVKKLKIMDDCADYDKYYGFYEKNKAALWGTSFGFQREFGQTEHIHMELLINEETENFILMRLEREGRGGTVTKISDGKYAYDIDLFDANEALPWIRTFCGRIAAFETTNPFMQQKFDTDIQRLSEMYGGDAE